MKKNLLTTMAILCAFVFGGMFTSCSTSDDNPSGSSQSVDPIAKKLCKEKTWFDQGNVEALNSVWAYTFNSDGTMMCSGLSKFGDPDQLIGLHFDGKWKEIKDYKDPYKVVNDKVRCYAVELKMKSLCIDDDEEVEIEDAPIYKDTLLVQYKGGEMKLVMASDIERYLGTETVATTRSTVSDLWELVKAAVAVGAITEEQLIETCIEFISNLDDEKVDEILGYLTDEDIEDLIAILEELTGEDLSDLIKGDDDAEE